MNRSSKQMKAYKARQKWLNLQEQKLIDEIEALNEQIKAEEEVQKSKSLRVTG